MKALTKIILPTVKLVAATALLALSASCSGLWLTADDGYYDTPAVDPGPCPGYWGNWGNPGYLPIVGTGFSPAPNHPGPIGPPPTHHHPAYGGNALGQSPRPGNPGLGGGNIGGAGASATVGTPTVIVH